MRRVDEFVDRAERRLFDNLLVRPFWLGPVGWRWRLILAYRALRGKELGGFREDANEAEELRQCLRQRYRPEEFYDDEQWERKKRYMREAGAWPEDPS